MTLNEHLARIRAIKTEKRAAASRRNGRLGGAPKRIAKTPNPRPIGPTIIKIK